MAYSDFTLAKIKEKFGVIERRKDLDLNKQELAVSELLKEMLHTVEQHIPVRTEKARCEFIVNPVLLDLLKCNAPFLTIHSGDELNVDKECGLVGECDFILSKNLSTIEINMPIITVVEAKEHDMDLGVSECAAQMLGAKAYNEQRGEKIDLIYGCVTTGYMWQFMKLENDIIYSDKRTYYLGKIEELLGAFQTIIDYYKDYLN